MIRTTLEANVQAAKRAGLLVFPKRGAKRRCQETGIENGGAGGRRDTCGHSPATHSPTSRKSAVSEDRGLDPADAKSVSS